jgi:cyclopropane-fatty-acyl-phospholipid synthase
VARSRDAETLPPLAGASSAPGVVDAWSRRRVDAVLDAIENGALLVEYPDGAQRLFGADRAAPDAVLRVHDWALFRRILWGGEVALGEAYVDGQWDAPDPAALLGLFHRNLSVFDAREGESSWPARLAHAALQRARRNSRAGSRANIAAHYDLGDGLYELFLDGSLCYSSAVYDGADDTLEAAQRRKIERLLERADLRPGQHVLEIGCGWGALSLAAARRGCRVTAITLSRNQLDRTRRRVRDAELDHLVRVELCDYRDVLGRYDRILSVEMIEAVGHEYLPGFFEACDRLLAPGGRVVLQAITMPDQRYDAYRRGFDWLRKYVFPGGLAPSLTALCSAMTRSSRLVVESLTNIGPHYARTLRDWRTRFDAATQALEERGYDARFRRLWRYYLAYCEAGFAAGTFGDLQLVLLRPEDRAAPALPGAR